MPQTRNSVYELDLELVKPIYLSKSDLIELDQILKDAEELLVRYTSELYEKEKVETDNAITARIAKAKEEFGYDDKPDSAKAVFDKRINPKEAYELTTLENIRKRMIVKKKLTLKQDTKFYPNFKSFSEALSSMDLEGSFQSFEIELSCGYENPSLEIKFGSNSFRTVSIRCTPYDSDVAEKIFTKVIDWFKDKQKNKFVHYWSKSGPTIPIIIALIVLLINITSKEVPSKLKLQIEEMLKSNITSENNYKAIEALLRISNGEKLTVTTATSPNLYLILSVAIIVFIFAFKPPATIIGIKNGEARLKRWNCWSTLISLTIPTWLAVNILWLLIEKLFFQSK